MATVKPLRYVRVAGNTTGLSELQAGETIDKADVGLGSVDNTSDANKPVSTAQATAIGLKLDASHAGTGGTSHANVIAAGASGFMTGADKTKLDSITGTNTGDQTTITGNAGTATALSAGADRTKLDGIAAGATNYTHPANHPASIIAQDASNRFVTDAEKTAWNAKQAAGSYQTLDADLTAIAALAGTSGLLKKTAADTWTLDTAAYTTNLGTVTGITGTAPIVSSGGTAPAISISAATTSVAGSMSAADKTKLDAITGTNTGDQTSIVGITGTLAQFNTAVTDADLQAALVSGTTIKTVGGVSLLGSGDIAVGGASGLTLLATITPTVAANVDFLSTFSSTYDDYLILVNGIQTGVATGSDKLCMQVAVSGAAVTSSSYFQTSASDTTASTAATKFTVSAAVDRVSTGGKGYSGRIHVQNANSSAGIKTASVLGISQYNSLSQYQGSAYNCASEAVGVLTGVRFFWNAASNFVATGQIRVYGYKNS